MRKWHREYFCVGVVIVPHRESPIDFASIKQPGDTGSQTEARATIRYKA